MGRDSNPRGLFRPNTLSKRAHSTTLPPIREHSLILRGNGVRARTLFAARKKTPTTEPRMDANGHEYRRSGRERRLGHFTRWIKRQHRTPHFQSSAFASIRVHSWFPNRGAKMHHTPQANIFPKPRSTRRAMRGKTARQCFTSPSSAAAAREIARSSSRRRRACCSTAG